MNPHGQYVPKWKTEQTTLASHIVSIDFRMLTMHEPVKTNLPAENK